MGRGDRLGVVGASYPQAPSLRAPATCPKGTTTLPRKQTLNGLRRGHYDRGGEGVPSLPLREPQRAQLFPSLLSPPLWAVAAGWLCPSPFCPHCPLACPPTPTPVCHQTGNPVTPESLKGPSQETSLGEVAENHTGREHQGCSLVLESQRQKGIQRTCDVLGWDHWHLPRHLLKANSLAPPQIYILR